MTRLYDDYADLYDLAFDWDITGEIEWLLGRFGPGCKAVLEPGCGSGRVLEAFARAGVEAVGIDSSAAMVEAARRRLEGLRAEAYLGDMRVFDLERIFDGAVCPINTLGHLARDDMAPHLECVAHHLRPGARYLVQLDLREGLEADAGPGSSWEVERDGVRLRASWAPGPVDRDLGVELQRSRFEFLEGERAGEVIEEIHEMTVWTPAAWTAAVEGSPFACSAVYDGNLADRPRVAVGTAGHLLWHELVKR
jgi:SAM-dependent methyltransferase